VQALLVAGAAAVAAEASHQVLEHPDKAGEETRLSLRSRTLGKIDPSRGKAEEVVGSREATAMMMMVAR